MTCPITELPTDQCACETHHTPEQTVLSLRAMERLVGHPLPAYRMAERQTLAEAAWQHYADHAPWVWHCPLCDQHSTANPDVLIATIVRHATEQHPAYLPTNTTVADMLASLPGLIREAVATIDAPNPDGPRVGGKPGGSDPAPFRQVRLLRAANAASASSLFDDLLTCSRIIWEAYDDTAKAAHPQPDGQSWALELGWLTDAWTDAQAYLDPVDCDWIDKEIRHITATFAAFAKIRHQPRYRCPIDGCHEQMHLGDDDWMTCAAGHQHPGPRRLEKQWRRKPPMPTSELCTQLRVPRRTLMWWQQHGKIKPTRTEGRSSYWLPWDVITLRYPDIVAEIDARDATKTTPV